MEERCARCNISGNDVRLFDAIYDGRMSQICERCSIIENVPVIKKPNVSQLKDAEKGGGVYERVRKVSGVGEPKKRKTFFIEDKLKELDKKPELERPEKEQLNLVEHFHWIIMKNRRHKGLTPEKLAQALGESELAVKMIEKAQLPENADVIIKKLEQFFQVKLRKFSEIEKLMKEKAKKPVLLDNSGNVLDKIPEIGSGEGEEEQSALQTDDKSSPEPPIKKPKVILKFGEESQAFPKKEQKQEPVQEEKTEEKFEEKFVEDGQVRDLDVKNVNLSSVTIGDLKGLHRKKIEATRQEKIEEQRRIEEGQRLVEARKEELRMKKEKESENLDKLLGGAELLENNDSEIREEFEDELV